MEAPAEHRSFHINPMYWNEQLRQSYQPYLAHTEIATGEVPSSSSKLERLKKPKVTRMCLLVSVVIAMVGLLMLVGLGVGLYYAFKPNTAPDPLLWPYGPDSDDLTLVGINNFQVDTAITGGIYLFGSNNQVDTVFVGLICQHASVVLSSNTVNMFVVVTGSVGEIDVPFDNLDPTKGKFCYYRKTSSDEDKEKLCRLIGGDVFTLAKPYEAHVYTFTNYTYEGYPVGTYQLIVAMTKSRTYVIRSYEVIYDIPGLTRPQFQMLGSVWPSTFLYETATVAGDVRGKKQVFDLTDAVTAPDLNDATPSTASGCA